MVFVAALKVLFVITVVIGGFTPYLIRHQRRCGAVIDTRFGAADGRSPRLFDSLADLIKLLWKEDSLPVAARPAALLLAPVLVAVTSIAVFAVIPFGGVYRFGATTLSLVIADLDWGLLYVLALAVPAALAAALTGWGLGTDRALFRGVRAAVQTVSYAVVFAAALVGVFMVFETLRPTELALAQDTVFHPVAGVAQLVGYDLPRGLGWLAAASVPNWGIFLQPLAFALSLVALMALNATTAGGGERAADPGATLRGELSGMRSGLFDLSEAVGVVAIAGISVTVFFGGWSVPYVSQQQLIAAVASFFGTGFATAVCMAVHVVCFLAKVAVVMRFQLALRSALPRFDSEQALCWKTLFPLAVANSAFTGLAILLREGMR